jgi:hypothetical protein
MFALLVVLFGAVGGAYGTTRWATLEAIHHLENPRNVTRPGAYGELGAYQFRPATWRMHTNLPFERALDRTVSDMVAVKHYDWLKRQLEKSGLAATPYNIALAWNGGLTAAVTGRAPRAAHDYASRAANLTAVFENSAQQVASAR